MWTDLLYYRAEVHLSGRIFERRFVCASVVLDDNRASANVNLTEIHIYDVIFQVKYCARVSFWMTVALARPSIFGKGALLIEMYSFQVNLY